MNSIRFAAASCLILIAVLAGCSEPSQDPSQAAAERRLENRERLRAQLGERYDEPVEPATPDQLIRGARLYQRLCSSCHGISGRGDGPMSAMLTGVPGNLTDPERAKFYSPRARIEILREGIPGTEMGPWGRMLEEADLQALFQFVDSLVENAP